MMWSILANDAYMNPNPTIGDFKGGGECFGP